MFSKIKSTTALVTCLSLGLHAPAIAQGNGEGRALGLAKQTAGDLGLEMCMDDAAPCVTEDNLVLLPAEAATGDLAVCAAEDLVAPCLREDGLVLADPESALVTEMMAGVTTEGGAVQVEDDAVMEAASSPAGDDDAAQAAAETDATAEAETEAVEGEATAEAGAETEAEAGSEEAVAETLEAPADGADAGAQIEEQTTAEVIEAPAENAEAGTQIEAETTAEVIEAPETETETSAEAGASAEAETEAAETQDLIEEEPVQATAAAAAATDEGASAEAEVVTEEVTDETARSAAEEFETAATVTTETEAAPAEDDSLSNFEKALLLGLGAVAVGSILDNGDEVVSNSGDRLVVRETDGELRVLRNDDALLRQPGAQVQTETFNDGSTRTTVLREDGTRIVTIRSADGVVLRRARVLEDGTQIILVDDTAETTPVRLSELPEPRPEQATIDASDEDALRAALAETMVLDLDRSFSLRQIREIREVRELAPQVELDAITFASGSAAIQPSQAEELAALGRVMSRIIEERPQEVFLIEGHTDAVGDASYNLALSDRRAETVALALTEYFDVPPENMVVQGYGERFLKIRTEEAERLNRRATVRRITQLIGLQTAQR